MRETGERNMEAVGDAACVWHTLDRALKSLCEVRDSLLQAGLDESVEGLQELVDVLEIAYAEAGSELTEVLLGGRGEARRWWS